MPNNGRQKQPAKSDGKQVMTTLGELVNAEAALRRMGDLPLPVKTAYGIAKLTRLVLVETRHFYEQREKWIAELGAERETTESERKAGAGPKTTEVAADSPQMPEFRRRVDELCAVDVTIPWSPIVLADLGKVDIKPIDLVQLGDLIADLPPDAAAAG